MTDFVVLWVDSSDPLWQAQRAQYDPASPSNGTAVNRFRDFDLMRYWFRGVETFAPWVNRVYFVTNGQRPAWLAPDAPKLVCVSHADFMPPDALPTFNSNAIELCLHNIPGLCEQFVLFNDDMFLCAEVKETDFFQNGHPVDTALLDAPSTADPDDCFPHMLANNAAHINRHFDKHTVLKQHFGKFFSPRLGRDLLRNLLLAPFGGFCAFRDAHLPTPHTKTSYARVWAEEEAALSATVHRRFRSKEDCTHWLVKNFRFCEGDFSVRKRGTGHHFELDLDDLSHICRAITAQTYRYVCLNDSSPALDYETTKAALHAAFETLLPMPSAFERF